MCSKALMTSLISVVGAANLPHIIHVVADDLGWAGVGYHREPGDLDVQTPVIDGLVKDGLELNRFYVHKICSPSRCAIQSGRNPIHVNVQNVLPEAVNPQDPVGGFQGIPTEMTGMAEVLQGAGYRTRMVGKWDVGMATEKHHPRARGYESWTGYWHHSNDYWKHTNDKCDGPVVDLWAYNDTFDGPATHLRNGKLCSNLVQNPPLERCVYEEEAFTNEVVSIIRDHDQSDPLFLFWALHVVHMPLQVPKVYEDKFSFIDNPFRRKNHAMGNYMDGAVGRVVDTLKDVGMWDNTLFVFHSDNGGEILFAGICGGNNWPLAGGKFSNFEGGIRVAAFVNGGALPDFRRGKLEESFVTGWDWYATYASIAGVDPTDHKAIAAGLPPIDSVDVWPMISGTNTTPPRTEILIADTAAIDLNGDGKTLVGGLIQNNFKLLVGAANKGYEVSQYTLTGPKWPNSTSDLIPSLHPKVCGRSPENGCLFDIFVDPTERNNLAMSRPDVFKAMLEQVDAAQETVYSPIRGTKDPRACERVNDTYDGTWGPFIFD